MVVALKGVQAGTEEMQREIQRPSQAHDEDHHPEILAVNRIGNLEQVHTAPGNQQGGESEHNAYGAAIQEAGIDQPVDLIRLVPGPVFGYELSDRSVETQVEKPEILDQGKYQHPDAIPLRPEFANNIGRKQKSN